MARQPKKGVFDLEIKRDDTGVSGSEFMRGTAMRRITKEEMRAMFPVDILTKPSEKPEPVKRPNLYIREEQLGVEDIGKFQKFSRDELVEYLPEGMSGELPQDIIMVPSRTKDVGIMFRKLTYELLWELEQLQYQKNEQGEFAIHKSGFLLDGKRGTGKSAVLNFTVMMARRNGWLVIFEPNPSRYGKDIAEIKRSNTGIYIQNVFAQQFLERTSVYNRPIFEDIPVDPEVYGKRGLDGSHINYNAKQFNPLINKAVDKAISKKKFASEIEEARERLRLTAQFRNDVKMPSMKSKLASPATLWDIVEFGLENEAYATQAVYELFAQLKNQTAYPCLVVVDDWNECFPTSQYVSIRYENTRYWGHIPNYHLTMPRAFHKWDGHEYKRGIKICATTWKYSNRRFYKPELLGVKDSELRTVREFSQHEYANFVAHYEMQNVVHEFPRDKLEYFYMLSQGNGWHLRKLLATLY